MVFREGTDLQCGASKACGNGAIGWVENYRQQECKYKGPKEGNGWLTHVPPTPLLGVPASARRQ